MSKNIQVFIIFFQNESWNDVFILTNLEEKFVAIINPIPFLPRFKFSSSKQKLNQKVSFKSRLSVDVLNLREKVRLLYSEKKHLEAGHPQKLQFNKLRRELKKFITKSVPMLRKVENSSNKNISIWEIVKDQRNVKHIVGSSISLKDDSDKVVSDPKILQTHSMFSF